MFDLLALLVFAALDGIPAQARAVELHPEAVGRLEICEQAERIARMSPCVEPGRCDAFEEWRRLFGEPGARMLEPGSDSDRGRTGPRDDRPPAIVLPDRMTAICPASPGR